MLSCTVVGVVHSTIAGGAIIYVCHSPPQDIHCTTYMATCSNPWDMSPPRDGNWKTLITKKEGTKTPDTGPEEFPSRVYPLARLSYSPYFSFSLCVILHIFSLSFRQRAGHSSPVPLLLMSPLSPAPFCSYHQLPGPLHTPS